MMESYKFTEETVSALLSINKIFTTSQNISLAQIAKYIVILQSDPVINVLFENPTNTAALGSLDQCIRLSSNLNMLTKRLLIGIANIKIKQEALGCFTNTPRAIKIDVTALPATTLLTSKALKEWARQVDDNANNEIYANANLPTINPNVKITMADLQQLTNMRYQFDLANNIAHGAFNMKYKSTFDIQSED